MLVVLADTFANPLSINAQETKRIIETARLFGSRVHRIPQHIDDYDSIFAYVPTYDEPILGIWVGVIPTVEHYQAVFHSALKKNIQLVNTPQQHQFAMEFDHFYPHLEDLTPKSIIIESLSDIPTTSSKIDFPVFVKGSVKSNKDGGWSAVVANDIDELTILAEKIFSNIHRSRGKVIIRELIDLKTVATDPNGFPIGREYRAFVYKGVVLSYGFYWDEYDDPEKLSGADKQAFKNLLQETAKRVDVPFLSIDIGQRANGAWIIIEIGDGQFSGLSQVSVLELWSKLKDLRL